MLLLRNTFLMLKVLLLLIKKKRVSFINEPSIQYFIIHRLILRTVFFFSLRVHLNTGVQAETEVVSKLILFSICMLTNSENIFLDFEKCVSFISAISACDV